MDGNDVRYSYKLISSDAQSEKAFHTLAQNRSCADRHTELRANLVNKSSYEAGNDINEIHR